MSPPTWGLSGDMRMAYAINLESKGGVTVKRADGCNEAVRNCLEAEPQHLVKSFLPTEKGC
eukprot:11526487-Prorocentrum_lima.AAC.1